MSPTSSRAHGGQDHRLPKSGPSSPFLLVLSHHLWSQTRPALASASCREPSWPWWWSWPSGDWSSRLWGWLAWGIGLPAGLGLGEQEAMVGRRFTLCTTREVPHRELPPSKRWKMATTFPSQFFPVCWEDPGGGDFSSSFRGSWTALGSSLSHPIGQN